MEIQISDRFFEDYRKFLKQRFSSENVADAIEMLIQKELRQFCVPGYEHDGLTGCKTRYQLEIDINQATFGNGWNDESIFTNRYACFDIDNFRNYLDNYGLPDGDKVLVIIAEQLHEKYPECNIYRFGGDEFVVEIGKLEYRILPNIPNVKLKYSIVEIEANRDRQRLHHLNRTIGFYLDKGIIESTADGAFVKLQYSKVNPG